MLPEQQPDDSHLPILKRQWVKDILTQRNGASAKQIELPPHPDQPEEMGYRRLNDKMFATLPEMLREPARHFSDSEERELFLVGALGVISGMLPNYTGNYFGSDVFANLYCFVIGRYGSGKGGLKWARMLAEVAHRNRLDEARKIADQHKRDKAHYNLQLAQYNKGKLAEPPAEPAPPAHLKLFIPANTTKTAVVQLLEENDGRGLIFETEGDTLADMLRQDYGNFSDILRKAYHHEPVSFFRRANNEDVSVERPAVSVVLSGTYDQLLKLIPSIDNGLYSRFMFYKVEGSDEFKDPFNTNDFKRSLQLERYASRFAALYDTLLHIHHSCTFMLTEGQQQRFVAYYRQFKSHTLEHVSEQLDGSVNRIALMTFRISMILTMLRIYETDPQLKKQMYTCTTDDFESAMHIMEVLTHNATDVYTYLDRYGLQRAPGADGMVTDEQKARCMVLKSRGMSLRKIAAEVLGNADMFYKVQRIIKSYDIA